MRNVVPQYRISVTTLEKFRRMMADTSSYDTEESLIESLEGKFTGNDKTRVGTAFHAIIETPSFLTTNHHLSVDVKAGVERSWVVINVDEYRIAIPMECAKVVADFSLSHPLMVHEVPVKKTYITPRFALQVGGRLDGVEGAFINDAKTKYRAPSDISDYTDSCQWKFYLDMTGAKKFLYDIFEVKRFKGLNQAADGICYLDGIDVVYHEPIPCTPFLGMGEYCTNLVHQFMEYIDMRNLFHLLKPSDEATAAAEATEEAAVSA